MVSSYIWELRLRRKRNLAKGPQLLSGRALLGSRLSDSEVLASGLCAGHLQEFASHGVLLVVLVN